MKDFILGNMVDDLVKYTLTICGKDNKKTLRFPRAFYSSFVPEIIKNAMKIQECIIVANGLSRGGRRTELQKQAVCMCVLLNHRIRNCYDSGWISDKQRDKWQKMTTAIKFKTLAWVKSDSKPH